MQTDTHWRCSNGCPNWNWRMLFKDYSIHDVEQLHTLRIQLFDKDIFTTDEMVGEISLDFSGVAKFAFQENIRQGAKVMYNPDTGEAEMKRIKWTSEKSQTMMNLNMYNKNNKGENEYRGTIYVSFEIVPTHIAELNQLGQGRDEPNRDPVLPEPAGRLSLASIGGGLVFGGFFCLAGGLKKYLISLLVIVLGLAFLAMFIYGFMTSFSGAFMSNLILG